VLNRLWLLLPLAVLLPAWLLLQADFGAFLLWWLALSALGWAAWPLASRLFPDGDRGYLLAKPLGLALASFLLWTLSHLKIMPFQTWAVWLASALVAAHLWLPGKGWHLAGSLWRDPGALRRAAAGELLFAAGLLFWTFARGLKPELTGEGGLEKFMDLGLMNSLWRTDYLPALDTWLAGSRVNYYYYGQYLYTFVAKMTGIRPEISYNLGMASTFAMTLTLGYATGSQLLQLARKKDLRLPACTPACGGLLSGILLAFGGNGHAFLFDPASPGHGLLLLLKRVRLVSGDPGKFYWFADATRFIGYNPETADKTIHEFPFYSFLVADLHAHVVNLMVVLLLIGLLVKLIDSQALLKAAAACHEQQQQPQPADDSEWHRQELGRIASRFAVTARSPYLLLAALCLGLSMMGNYWDFAIYFVVSAAVLLLVNSRGYSGLTRPGSVLVFLLQMALLLVPYLGVGQPAVAAGALLLAALLAAYLTILRADALTLTGAQMAWIFFLAHLLTLPFSWSFEPIAKSIALALNRTPPWQLLVLWGPHLLAGCLMAAVLLLWRQPGGRMRKAFPPDPAEREAALMPGGWLKRTLRLMNPADLLALAFFFCAAGLILVPELVYVVDIYSGDFKRANTMFKFTYQAFVLLTLAWAYAAARINAIWIRQAVRQAVRPAKPSLGLETAAGLLLAFILLIPFWYPVAATEQWLGSFKRDNYRGLNGMQFFAQKDTPQLEGALPGELAADVAAIEWLNREVKGQPVILESFGESYTDYCRISVFTGLPAVLGWETHEWLWRTSKATPNAYGSVVRPRQEEVRSLYTSDDQGFRRALLEHYQVAYIVVGDLERARFTETGADGQPVSLVREDLLLELGSVVFSEQSLYIIKVD
jgi:YYY domain-containing protein